MLSILNVKQGDYSRRYYIGKYDFKKIYYGIILSLLWYYTV